MKIGKEKLKEIVDERLDEAIQHVLDNWVDYGSEEWFALMGKPYPQNIFRGGEDTKFELVLHPPKA